jgi:hypothetical protein
LSGAARATPNNQDHENGGSDLAVPAVPGIAEAGDDVAAAVERAAAEDGMSFSAWLSAAAARRLRARAGLRAVQEWDAEVGPLTPEERAAGEALLDRLLAGATAADRQA